MTFWIPDYWDFCTGPNDPGYVAHNTSPDGVAYTHSTFNWDAKFGGTTRQDDYDTNNEWVSSWWLKDDSVRGVLEVADAEPKQTAFDKALLFWSPSKTMVYTDASPIQWGGSVVIGGWLQRQIVIDNLRSAYLPPFPGWWGEGWQRIRYIAHHDTWTDVLGRVHPDVIELMYWQWFGHSDPNDKSGYGGKMFLRKGVGRVGLEWFTFDKNLVTAPGSNLGQIAVVYTGSKVLLA